MKKLLFSLIASVMFGNLSFGSEIKKEVLDVMNVENVILPFAYCLPITISYGSGGFSVSTKATVCCGRVKMGNSYGYGCWGIGSKPVGYIDIETLDPSFVALIKTNKLKTIIITKSDSELYEGRTYSVVSGDYTIQTDKEGSFIQVNLAAK